MSQLNKDKDLTITFNNSNTLYPKNGQEIKYFNRRSGGFDSYGYELSHTKVEYSILVVENEDYTGTCIVYEGNEYLLDDKEHYQLVYCGSHGEELPTQFYWIDLEDYFQLCERLETDYNNNLIYI